jgi:hypothetical protein
MSGHGKDPAMVVELVVRKKMAGEERKRRLQRSLS